MALFVLLASAPLALAQVPDLTNGGVRTDNGDSNLGPTGLRGWMYHNSGDSSASRQILITAIDAGSPAALQGGLAVGDVILGASGTGAAPVPFTSDARRTLGYAIGDAEAQNPAVLKLLRWRNGEGTTTVDLTLQHLGAYSATAPYNCPKSAAILENGLDRIMAVNEQAGVFSLGTLILMAADDPANPDNPARRARIDSHILAIRNVITPDLDKMNSEVVETHLSKAPWLRGHHLIILVEYYRKYNDPTVVPLIHALINTISKGQSPFGTMGHEFAGPWYDGRPNGPMNGYGSVNSAAVPAFLGLTLAKAAGITHPKLDDGITRAGMFYASYAGKGSIPYGEHIPGADRYSGNGKSGAAALAFERVPHNFPGIPTREFARDFNTQMAIAAANEREMGHTGSGFNILWSPLGAAVGGKDAVVSFFQRAQWHYDLTRRWDYNFEYRRLDDERSGFMDHWNNLYMSTAVMLTYALPMQNLYITGAERDLNNPYLSPAEIAQAAEADGYVASSRTTAELIEDLNSFAIPVRTRIANELASRTSERASILATLTAIAKDVNSPSRSGACEALGRIGDPSSLPLIINLLSDPDNNLRYNAARSLYNFPQATLFTQIYELLSVASQNARPTYPLWDQDPAQLSNMMLLRLIFDNTPLKNSLTGIDRTYLLPAIRGAVTHPFGAVRGFGSQMYQFLTPDDVNALADVVVDSTRYLAPGDAMFGGHIRNRGSALMQRLNIAEGVQVIEDVCTIDSGPGTIRLVLPYLAEYGGSVNLVNPDPETLEFLQSLWVSDDTWDWDLWTDALPVIEAINSDTNFTAPVPFKSIQSVTADQPTLTLPSDRTVLRVKSFDHAKGESFYTWRKIHGAGNVTFSPNGTAASRNTNILFDGTPGEYLFEVTMADTRGITEVTGTVAVTLLPSGGTLPANAPPVATAQTLSAETAVALPIILTGTDAEGYALSYSILTKPTNGKLEGTPPYLTYTSNFNYTGPDSFTFQVMDSEGQLSSATVNLTVGAAAPIGLAIYEPFNYAVGSLNGQSGGGSVGFSAPWVTLAESVVTADSIGYGSLATAGNKLFIDGTNTNARTASRAIEPSALAGNGLLDDGATLWFSVTGAFPTTAAGTLNFALANSPFRVSKYARILDEGAQPGEGVGFSFSAGSGFMAATFGSDTGTPAGQLAKWDNFKSPRHYAGDSGFVVGKITWGATPSDPDLIELYEPFTDMRLPSQPTTSLTTHVNQSTFDTITMFRGNKTLIDEIRFGPTYRSVLRGTAAMNADTTPPVPSPMTFASMPAQTSPTSIRMVAATAFDPYPAEYLFTCTAGGGPSSGWQSSPEFIVTGLTNGNTYSYTVTARDLSPARNQTAPSAVASVTLGTSIPVPLVLDLPQQEAEDLIEAMGFTVGTVTTAPSATTNLGDVAVQTPVAGTTAAVGSPVNLVISTTLQRATIPNIVGVAQASASAQIVAADLIVGAITTDYHPTIPAGAVISTNPAVGSQVDFASSVDLLVSAGSLADLMPPTSVLFEDFENPITPAAYVAGSLPDNGNWIGSNALARGITDKAGGDFTALDPNYQAFALRQQGTGITTAEGKIGAIQANTRYTLTFDVIRDGNLSPGTDYFAQLVAFDPGAARGNTASNRPGSVLGATSGSATSDGSITRVTLVVNIPAGDARIGMDLGIRFLSPNSATNALIDNVQLIAEGAPLADQVYPTVISTTPADNATGVGMNDILTITFNENVFPGTGFFTLLDITDGTLEYFYSTNPSSVTFLGNTLRLHPVGGLLPNKQYTVFASVGSVVDNNGNRFAGITGVDTWNFTTTDADVTTPTLVITNELYGDEIEVSKPVIYDLAFSERIDAATLTAADFVNGGSAGISIGAITEVTPGVFNVVVTPTSVGTLNLQVLSTAVINDLAGNPLVTSPTIADAETLTVIPLQTSLITYNANGSDSGTVPLSQEKSPGVPIVLQQNSGTLIKSGFTFVGWNTAADGSGTDYPAGSTYTVDAPLTLFADWEPGADGTWLPTAAGTNYNWTDTNNWFNGLVPEGTNRSAFFTPNILGAQTANISGPLTIGNITFTDAVATHDITISGGTLTLDRTDGAPIIDVTQSNRTLTIASDITSTDGLQKNGPGTLTLSSANNSLAGDIIMNGGRLNASSPTSVPNGGKVLFSASSTFDVPSGSMTYNGDLVINSAVTATMRGNMSYTGVFQGDGLLEYNAPGTTLTFTNLANTFTGPVKVVPANSGTATVELYSIVDNAMPIELSGSGSGTAQFRLGSMTGAPPIRFHCIWGRTL